MHLIKVVHIFYLINLFLNCLLTTSINSCTHKPRIREYICLYDSKANAFPRSITFTQVVKYALRTPSSQLDNIELCEWQEQLYRPFDRSYYDCYWTPLRFAESCTKPRNGLSEQSTRVLKATTNHAW